jgi:hypothetical protein
MIGFDAGEAEAAGAEVDAVAVDKVNPSSREVMRAPSRREGRRSSADAGVAVLQPVQYYTVACLRQLQICAEYGGVLSPVSRSADDA